MKTRTMIVALAALVATAACSGEDDVAIQADATSTSVQSATADLPSFSGTYKSSTWSDEGLVDSTWEITYRSSSDWAKELVSSEDSRARIRVVLKNGKLSEKTLGAQGASSEETVDGPLAPESWLHAYDLDSLDGNRWTSEASNDGTTTLTERTLEECQPGEAVDRGAAPRVFRCRGNANKIEAVTTYHLNEQGIPTSLEVRYDGDLVGAAEFIELRMG